LTKYQKPDKITLSSNESTSGAMNAPVRERPSKEATVQNSTVPAANPQALLNSYLYKFNLSMAAMKEHRALEADCYGQVGCAKLLRIQRDNYLDDAAKYAPKPEPQPVAFCAAAARALVAYDVPFVSGAVGNVRPEQIVRL